MCEQSIEGHELLLESRQAWIEGRAARALKRGAKRYERGKDVHGTARESNGLVRPFRLATYVGCVLCASLSGLGGGIHSTTVDESKILCSKPDFCLAVPPPRTSPAAMRSYRIVDLPVALAVAPLIDPSVIPTCQGIGDLPAITKPPTRLQRSTQRLVREEASEGGRTS